MSLNVLWLDDEPGSLRYEWKIAEHYGWQITSANAVSKALKHIEEEAFDLVVVDLILPLNEFEQVRGHVTPDAGMTFIESLRDPSRSGHTSPNVPLLVVTADVSLDLKERGTAKLSSPRHYLRKPLEEQLFCDIVKEVTRALSPHPDPTPGS